MVRPTLNFRYVIIPRLLCEINAIMDSKRVVVDLIAEYLRPDHVQCCIGFQ